ncbi:hypothetical protein [Melittangium boletus]|uniref:DoxX family protein n=1 Tax=Melittangium boletus DSM 14713 TaxID=1294270 RepID=A0A250I915_9BACT|nr:hypothetical protein [Melittangium boletus]ATB27627.1 hypothetical protein MEBOL_001071 [Melittangium boletus DSM 14713]
MSKTLVLNFARVLGLGLLANGIYMLVSPGSWYVAVPGVITTGPFNQHFLRDIGLIFLLLGTAFLLGASRPGARTILWSTATFWLCGHALFHFWEVGAGICGPSAIPRDFPAVTLPAIIGVVLSLWSAKDERAVQASAA